MPYVVKKKGKFFSFFSAKRNEKYADTEDIDVCRLFESESMAKEVSDYIEGEIVPVKIENYKVKELKN